jgi:hypothetical protein
VQHRLEQLEARLANPEHSDSVVAYYQLRDIWESCHQRLTSLSADLEQAQRDKGERLHQAAFKRQLDKSLEGERSELQSTLAQADEQSAHIRVLREKRSMRRGIWNFFRRRALTAEIHAHREQHRGCTRRTGELSEEIQKRMDLVAPNYMGIDVADKRTINLMLIACAQELFLHFAERDLAAKARDAAISQVTDASYGSKRNCRAISKYVEDRIKALAGDTKLQARIQVRTQWLATHVAYRNDAETAPEVASLMTIAVLKPDGRQKGDVPVNVLGEEYWDLFSVLVN